MIILVCGGREFNDLHFVWNALDDLHAIQQVELLVHGAARGADSLAESWALRHGVQPVGCPANWDYYKNASGPIRNAAMFKLHPALVVAFEGNNGTNDSIRRAHQQGIPVWQPHLKTYDEFVASYNPLEQFLV